MYCKSQLPSYLVRMQNVYWWAARYSFYIHMNIEGSVLVMITLGFLRARVRIDFQLFSARLFRFKVRVFPFNDRVGVSHSVFEANCINSVQSLDSVTYRKKFRSFRYITKAVAETYFQTVFQSNLHTESKAWSPLWRFVTTNWVQKLMDKWHHG